ncbi:MAG: DUF883 family protein [Phycisphaerales bacterium]
MAETASNKAANIKDSAEIDQLRADLAALRKDFSTLGKDVLTATRHGAESASEAARAEAQRRLEQLGDAWEGARDRSVAAKHDVERRIEEHPLASVMIALGVGVVIGKLIDRR